MHIFRIHIKPKSGRADMETTFDYCLKEKILGVGWRTKSNKNTKDWDEYYQEASQGRDNLHVCGYIKNEVHRDDLVWTCDPTGRYYLARVLSGWEYWTTEESQKKDIDIANIFRCDIKLVSAADVPGKVIDCFKPPKSIQKIKAPEVWNHSRRLWNALSGQEIYKAEAMPIC